MKAGITISKCCNVSGDENGAYTCLTAVEAGMTKVITATYPVMKITRVSLQSKLDELLYYCSHLSVD